MLVFLWVKQSSSGWEAYRSNQWITLVSVQFSLVQSLSPVGLFATPWITALQASLSITNSRSLLRPMPIESVMPSSHLILCRPLLLLPPIPPSIRVFSSESTLYIRWPKYWSFRFSVSPSSEHPGLISFRMDWLDLLAVQGTLKSLLQHHSSKASALWRLAFFIAQLSHPCMITRKTIALTRWTFVGKVMSLLFNMLSRLVIAFLPRSKRLYFMAAITICSDFGAQENKASHCFHCFPISALAESIKQKDPMVALLSVFTGASISTCNNTHRNQRSNCQHPLDHWKSKRVSEKHLFLLYWLCQSLWLCGSQ